VVGCDGFQSTCRTSAGIDLIGHDITEPWAVFDANQEGWRDSYEGNYAYLDVILVILTALPDRRWRVYLRPSSPYSDLVADAASTIGRYLPTVGFAGIAGLSRGG
jgi:2-polyprenyl-6-methoxyphenol hydroxylase-like FAD-dependent oxidoreductase